MSTEEIVTFLKSLEKALEQESFYQNDTPTRGGTKDPKAANRPPPLLQTPKMLRKQYLMNLIKNKAIGTEQKWFTMLGKILIKELFEAQSKDQISAIKQA